MTTHRDHGAIPVAMLRCPFRADHHYRSRDLALRDLRQANGRCPDTGDGDGNDSWIGLTLAMIVLDSLSGLGPVGQRWRALLTRYGITPMDATIIYELRCSLHHGYGLPKPGAIGDRRVVMTGELDAYAVDTEVPGIARVSVPAFCGRLVERIASAATDGWDESLIDTEYRG